MVAINKSIIILAVVASVLVGAACAQETQEGGIRAFGRKMVERGSDILSHIPIVNNFFGHSEKAPAAPAEKPEEMTDEQTEATPVEEPVQQEETLAVTPADTPAATTAETPAETPVETQEETKAEEPTKAEESQ